MKGKIIIGLIIVGLIGPFGSLALTQEEEILLNQDKIELTDEYSKKIFLSLVQKLTDEWIDISSGINFQPEQEAIMAIVTNAIQVNLASYLILQMPYDIGKTVIKTSFRIITAFLSENPGEIIGQLERMSVDKAKQYIFDWLLQKELRGTAGLLKLSYKSITGGFWEIKMPHTILYKPINGLNEGEAVITIFSPKEADAPLPIAGLQWAGGVEKIRPFILYIKGTVKRKEESGSWHYQWLADPLFEFVLDEPVPDLQITELNLLEQWSLKIEKRLLLYKKIGENALELSAGPVSSAKNTVTAFLSNIKEATSNIAEKLKEVVAGQKTPAALVNNPYEDDIPHVNTEELSRIEDNAVAEVEQLEKLTNIPKVEELQKPEIPGTGGPKGPSLESIQEILDDIADQVDLLSAEIIKITGNKGANSSEDIGNQNIQEEENSDENNQNKKVIQNTKANTSHSELPLTPRPGGQSSTINLCTVPEILFPSRDSVIINEIAWMGNNESGNNEWLELKNISDVLVGLSSWQIQDKARQIKISFPEGMEIAAGGFFLLERTNDESVPEVPADMLYAGSLNDEDEALYLFNQECQLQDSIVAIEGWPGGDKENKKTMERGIDFSWHTHAGTEKGGILGTPRAENSQIEELGEEENNGPTDTSAPDISFSLNPIQYDLSFNIFFEITDSSIGDVTPSGLDSFVFRWKKGEGNWQEEEKTLEGELNYQGEKLFEAENEQEYFFQIKATDKAGNESLWIPEEPAITLVNLPKKLVINEIQIDNREGTGGSDNDWVELYNPNDFAVSLKGWSLQKQSKDDPCSLGSGFYKKNFSADAVIPAGGFFLVTDTESDDYLQSLADMTIGWSLSNDATVYLVHGTAPIESAEEKTIVDTVGFGSACFFETTPAVNPPESKSIGRVDGNDTDNNGTDFVVQEIANPVNSQNEDILSLSPWPAFLGNFQRNSRSPFSGPASPAPSVIWKYDQDTDLINPDGPYYNNPVIDAEGTLYTYSNSIKRGLLALNSSDGSQKWFKQTPLFPYLMKLLPDNSVVPDNDYGKTFDQEGNYYQSEDNILYSFDKEGIERWRMPFEFDMPEGEPCHLFTPIATQPAINKSSLFVIIKQKTCNVIGDTEDYLYEFSLEGQEHWKINLGGYDTKSPAVTSDGTVYIINLVFGKYSLGPSGYLKAVSQGEMKWEVRLWDQASVFTSFLLTDKDGNVYFSLGGETQAYDPSGYKLWSMIPEGPSKWHIGFPALILGTDGTLYITARGVVFAIQ